MWNGVDRRRFARVQYPCLVTVRRKIPLPFSILTHTENISVGGVCIIIGKKIEAMTEVDLEIDLKDTLPNVASRGTIVWVKEIPPTQKGEPSSYDTGIQFIALKEKDRRRIENIVNRFMGKTG